MVDSQASDIPLTDLDRLDPAREEFIRVQRASCETRLTKRIVSLLADDISARIVLMMSPLATD